METIKDAMADAMRDNSLKNFSKSKLFRSVIKDVEERSKEDKIKELQHLANARMKIVNGKKIVNK